MSVESFLVDGIGVDSNTGLAVTSGLLGRHSLDPVCDPDFGQTTESVPVEIDVLDNDTIWPPAFAKLLRVGPGGGGPWTSTLTTPNGFAEVIGTWQAGDLRVRWTPDPGYTGIDFEFWYHIFDSYLNGSGQQVTTEVLSTSVPTTTGLDFVADDNRLHIVATTGRLHYSAKSNRLHFKR